MTLATLAAATAAITPAPCALEGAPADFEKVHKVECGWVTVPARQGAPKTIRLWTARIHARGPAKRADPIIYINGGPGIATVDSILPAFPTSKNFAVLAKDRDIILFDQRGSGRSEENLCPELAKTLSGIGAKGLDPAVESERGRQAFAACRKQAEAAGMRIEDYTTAAIVADLDQLRRAFGVESWNLLSVSYGSLVAMQAMRGNSAHIRSVILNSPYPPNSVTWAEQASSAAAAYHAIDRECAAQPACRSRFGGLVPKLEETLARLEKTPLLDGEKRITGRLFASALWPLAVRSATVQFVPLAIERAHSGDEKFIKAMVSAFAGGDSFGGFSPAQGYAISCHESGRTAVWYRRAKSLYPSLVDAAPAESWDRMCETYRPGFADPNFFAPVASSIPTLVYAGTLDPATPVIDAYQALRFLDRATLVEVAGGSHAPIGVDDCTRSIAEQFLAAPDRAPELSCIAQRKLIEFATEGLDELLTPPTQ